MKRGLKILSLVSSTLVIAAAATATKAVAEDAVAKKCQENTNCNESHWNWPNCALIICDTGLGGCKYSYQCQ